MKIKSSTGNLAVIVVVVFLALTVVLATSAVAKCYAGIRDCGTRFTPSSRGGNPPACATETMTWTNGICINTNYQAVSKCEPKMSAVQNMTFTFIKEYNTNGVVTNCVLDQSIPTAVNINCPALFHCPTNGGPE